MMPINQDNAGNFLFNLPGRISGLKEGTIEAIEAIGKLSKIVLNSLDWIGTILLNPIIILTFVDKMSIVIILSLIILKSLGFHNLEKWILLSVLIKIIAMILL